MLDILEGAAKRTTLSLVAAALACVSLMMAQSESGSELTNTPSRSSGDKTVHTTKMTASEAPVPVACDKLNDQAPPGSHTVKLSWNASVPLSASAADKVIGYIVYRSTIANDMGVLPLNIRRLIDTTCVDMHVSPGVIYYYVIRAVSARGAVSAPSNAVRVEIPREGHVALE